MKETLIIYAKLNEHEFQTKVILSDEKIPDGWVLDPNDLHLTPLKGPFQELQEKNELLELALVEMAETQSIHDDSIAELANLFSVGGESK